MPRQPTRGLLALLVLNALSCTWAFTFSLAENHVRRMPISEASLRQLPIHLQSAADSAEPAETAASDAATSSASDDTSSDPKWFEDIDTTPAEPDSPMVAAVPDPAPLSAPEPEEPQMLVISDLLNTKWKVEATPREDSWLKGGVRQQEFTLLDDSTVVWGGSAGGFGTGGRWALKDGIIEVIRSTPLGIVTGRDYYMARAAVQVDDQLQFQLTGIIRSYNALFPVMVIADFEATRMPGRFVRNTDEEED